MANQDDAPFDFRAWREAHQLSFRLAAKVFGVAVSTIQQWEKKPPGTLVELACLALQEHPEKIADARTDLLLASMFGEDEDQEVLRPTPKERKRIRARDLPPSQQPLFPDVLPRKKP